ncbi:DoxX family protein [Priestia megaterium]|uniref:DoxX family protein n=1 Tax=Priestia megaterium TaxID=1404 RepID=UPI00203B2E2B|nr:DoxX family protein [Priestia megaterium]MCM3186854.1 DoxX family protein [Priestia megaterium]
MKDSQNIGSLILRVVLGLTFFIHGFVKFQGGIEHQVTWFKSIGIPGVMAYGTASIELIGGALLFIGLGTRIISVIFVLLMLGSIITVKFAVGFLGNGQMAGYELDLAYASMAVYLAINGSELFSIDHLIRKKSDTH